MPRTVRVLTHITGTTPTGEPPTPSLDTGGIAQWAAGGTCDQGGWPVTPHQVPVPVSLHHDVSALAIPVQLCREVTEVLTQRRCAPPVLAHPDAPKHRIVLTAERYPVRLLLWPAGAHQITGVLPPPTVTPADRSPGHDPRRRIPRDCAAKLIFLRRRAPCWAAADPRIGQLAVRCLPES